MRLHPGPSALVGAVALLLAGSPPAASGQTGDAPLPVTPIGGIPVEVVVELAFDVREAIDGYELYAVEGGWTHTQEGRLLRNAGWLAHQDRIEHPRGAGREVCWYDWGQPAGTPHWTVQWSSELNLPAPMHRASPASKPLPPIHLAIDGTDVLVIYAPPREFGYAYPGSVDDCQNVGRVPPHQRTGSIVFYLDDVDVARPPGAEDAYDVVIQDGIVLLRLPLARLAAGTTDIGAVNLSGTEGDVAWGVRIGVTVTSQAGRP
jgi:hypothetical protein